LAFNGPAIVTNEWVGLRWNWGRLVAEILYVFRKFFSTYLPMFEIGADPVQRPICKAGIRAFHFRSLFRSNPNRSFLRSAAQVVEEATSLFGWAENGWFQPLGCIQPFGWAETSRSARGHGWDRRALNPPPPTHPLPTVP
jgi:hypothetical protein